VQRRQDSPGYFLDWILNKPGAEQQENLFSTTYITQKNELYIGINEKGMLSGISGKPARMKDRGPAWILKSQIPIDGPFHVSALRSQQSSHVLQFFTIVRTIRARDISGSMAVRVFSTCV
jgi:hypothetical protein